MEADRSQLTEAEVQSLPTPSELPFTEQAFLTCLDVLQTISEAPELVDDQDRFKSLITKIHRTAKKQKKQQRQRQIAAADRRAIESTTIVRQLIPHSPFKELADSGLPSPEPAKRIRPHSCYICKTPYTQLHHFYHRLCPGCAELNWQKRNERVNLNGRIALVTGGRIKIGYQTVLKLLRDDAAVVTTTRFPVDAARRFQQEPDFEDWRNRLEIHQLDLRNLTSVETFADAMISSQSHLDILIHNAAQTVKRPLAYYQHLLSTHCDSEATTLIHSHHNPFALLESHPEYKGHIAAIEQYFPTGLLDVHEQQVDLRPMNSWRNKIEDISTIEMLEVYLVNAAAPFILTRRLKTLLRRSPSQRRFIVNVSAMEGQFGRLNKTVFHPHTNMAKAALNMLTRTSAADFAESSIYMNSVDTGWITDEKPTPLADQVRDKHGFYPPLDVIDGAARIYAPIVQGYSEPDEPYCGCFLKDYQPHPW